MNAMILLQRVRIENMLTIVGDVIEYDGKPFAIITAPLSGWRMDAVDCVNNQDMFLIEAIEDRASERVADAVKAVYDIIDRSIAEVWLNEEIAIWLKSVVALELGD